jgi:hypothetical protein
MSVAVNRPVCGVLVTAGQPDEYSFYEHLGTMDELGSGMFCVSFQKSTE